MTAVLGVLRLCPEAAGAGNNGGDMTWTTTPPTEPGYYWLREWLCSVGGIHGHFAAVEMARVDADAGVWLRTHTGAEPLSWFDPLSLWAGPLHPPGDLP